MDITYRYPIQLGELDKVEIHLIGCGGTGSFAALHIARLAYHLKDMYSHDLTIWFVDGDTVEAKNIGRQNFCPAEIGHNKAQALMLRYNRAFGLDIRADPNKLNRERHRFSHNAIGITIGCVDNAAARRVIAKQTTAYGPRHHLWWIDAGNHDRSGQVLIGNSADPTPAISPFGFCESVPIPSVQCPELLDAPLFVEDPAESCAELVARDAQSLMVNQACAGWIGVYLSRLLISGDLDIMATYFDLETGSARSEPITNPNAVARPIDVGAALWGEDLN